MAFKVFISYSTKDLKVAESVQRILRGAQTDVFMAERSVVAGEALPERIKKAIIECDLFLLLWSRNSKESDWVRHEVGAADGRNKVIIPIVIDRRAKLPAPLHHIKYLPAYKSPEQAFHWLRENVFTRAEQKQQREGLVWLALGVAAMFLAERE